MQRQPVRTPQLPGLGSSIGKKFSIADISGKGQSLPNRYALHACEGWGKTSFGAMAPRPIFLQVKGETGLDTLIDANQLPPTPHFPELQDWMELRSAIQTLIDEPHDYRTLVIDTLNGAERQCFDYICHRDFSDEWGEKGFTGYQRGPDVALAEWKMFLNQLDELRAARKMVIILLIHTKIKQFKNPDGPDYDKWQPDMNEKTWGQTHKWLDCVLFGNFEVTVNVAKGRGEDSLKKGKADQGSTVRMLYTQQRPAYYAKNRLGLPEEIYMGESPQEAWAAFAAAVVEGRKKMVNPLNVVETRLQAEVVHGS